MIRTIARVGSSVQFGERSDPSQRPSRSTKASVRPKFRGRTAFAGDEVDHPGRPGFRVGVVSDPNPVIVDGFLNDASHGFRSKTQCVIDVEASDRIIVAAALSQEVDDLDRVDVEPVSRCLRMQGIDSIRQPCALLVIPLFRGKIFIVPQDSLRPLRRHLSLP